MKTIESLSGTLNGSGTFNDSGLSAPALWEHPDKSTHWVQLAIGVAGIKFRYGAAEIAIGMTDLMTLASTHEESILPQLPAVTAAPSSGASPQTVTLSCTQAGVTIRYTTNGTTPTSGSTAYTTPLNIASATTLKAIAFKSLWRSSAVATFTYT